MLYQDTIVNISFFIRKENYLFWADFLMTFVHFRSAGVGMGQPPEDTISTTIIIVILCGVGIPAALIIFGGIAVCIKKRRDRYKGYEDLSENDVAVNT